jgi:hypothetical protein
MLGNGLLNLALAAGKFGAAAGVEAGTSGIGTALALYGVYRGGKPYNRIDSGSRSIFVKPIWIPAGSDR